MKHQAKCVEDTWSLPGYAFFHEMGTGKSLTALATAEKLRQADKINRVLWVTPNMLHSSFVNDEVPKHYHELPAWIYDTGRATSIRYHREFHAWCQNSPWKLLSMSYDSLLTERGYIAARQFLISGAGLLVADESQRIKNPKAQRTKALLKLAALAPYRRILTGTPVANSPFDLYTQIQFIDPIFWQSHGIGSYWAFRTRYGVFKQAFGVFNGARRQYNQLLGYQNMDELQAIIAKISSRVLKSEVLDLPPVVETRRTFALARQQREIYDSLRDTYVVELRAGILTAPMTLVRLLRLQQITSGFVVPDATLDTFNCGIDRLDSNPRLDLLREILEDVSESCIIWAKYDETVNTIMTMLGDKAVQLDGQVSAEERTESLRLFNEGKKQFIVSKAAVGGVGLNMTIASTMIFVERGYSSMEYQQAVARANRYGQSKSLQVINLCAIGTVDEKITEALERKQELMDQLLGDHEKVLSLLT